MGQGRFCSYRRQQRGSFPAWVPPNIPKYVGVTFSHIVMYGHNACTLLFCRMLKIHETFFDAFSSGQRIGRARLTLTQLYLLVESKQGFTSNMLTSKSSFTLKLRMMLTHKSSFTSKMLTHKSSFTLKMAMKRSCI